MKLSDGVEWGVHCCTVLAALPEGTALPAARLAEFHGVPAAYLAKHLQALSRAGVVTTEPGQRGGYRLARRPAEISLWDVVAAVDGGAPAFRCTEIRRRGPAALPDRQYTRGCGINRAMQRAEQAWKAELQATSLADILADLRFLMQGYALCRCVPTPRLSTPRYAAHRRRRSCSTSWRSRTSRCGSPRR